MVADGNRTLPGIAWESGLGDVHFGSYLHLMARAHEEVEGMIRFGGMLQQHHAVNDRQRAAEVLESNTERESLCTGAQEQAFRT